MVLYGNLLANFPWKNNVKDILFPLGNNKCDLEKVSI